MAGIDVHDLCVVIIGVLVIDFDDVFIPEIHKRLDVQAVVVHKFNASDKRAGFVFCAVPATRDARAAYVP